MFLVGGTGLGAKRDTVSKTVSLFQAFCWERLSRCICFSHSALDKRLEMVLSKKVNFPEQDSARCLRQSGTPSSQT